jgi:hypothetical protein
VRPIGEEEVPKVENLREGRRAGAESEDGGEGVKFGVHTFREEIGGEFRVAEGKAFVNELGGRGLASFPPFFRKGGGGKGEDGVWECVLGKGYVQINPDGRHPLRLEHILGIPVLGNGGMRRMLLFRYVRRRGMAQQGRSSPARTSRALCRLLRSLQSLLLTALLHVCLLRQGKPTAGAQGSHQQ